MATDIEEFESAIILVCNAHEDLQKVNSNNSFLSFIKLAKVGFKPSPEYQKRYVKPHLRSPDGQLCLWDWAYPNQFEAKMSGLLDYNHDLSIAIRTEISERGLNKLVSIY